MKLGVKIDEWHPVLTLTDNFWFKGSSSEFTKEELEEGRKVEMAFNEWQRKIAERFDLMPTEFSLIDVVGYDDREK